MIVVRAPVRISFGGGGTDLAAYYRLHGGFVLSAAIARYAYVVASEPRHGGIRLTSADYGVWEAFARGEAPQVCEPLSLPKAAVNMFADHGLLQRGVELFTASEVRPGTGLGSSSAMAVALVAALTHYLKIDAGTHEIADAACRLEIERLDMPIGKQDQYASAFGGINTMSFSKGGVQVDPLPLPPDVISSLESRLLLFSTGQSRNSAVILREQRRDTTSKASVANGLHAIKRLAHEMRDALAAQDLDSFGALLHDAWCHKRALSGRISTGAIDAWYDAARDAGALGGKITGAGGGGFLLLFCGEGMQHSVRGVMATAGLTELPFEFDFNGTRTIPPGDLAVEAAMPARLIRPEHGERNLTVELEEGNDA